MLSDKSKIESLVIRFNGHNNAILGYLDRLEFMNKYSINSLSYSITQGNQSLYLPRGVFVENSTNIFISDSGNDLVYRYNGSYDFIETIGMLNYSTVLNMPVDGSINNNC